MNSEVVILDAYFELTASQILKMSDLEDLSGLTQSLCKSPNSESGVDSDCILYDVLHLESYYNETAVGQSMASELPIACNPTSLSLGP